jgi:hypothetical protein
MGGIGSVFKYLGSFLKLCHCESHPSNPGRLDREAVPRRAGVIYHDARLSWLLHGGALGRLVLCRTEPYQR